MNCTNVKSDFQEEPYSKSLISRLNARHAEIVRYKESEMNDKIRYKRQLQAESFAVTEAALYLDGHPHDKAAMDYYNKHNARLKSLAAKYEKEFGPLTMFSNNSCTWEWTADVWPWEYEAN